MNLKVLLPNEIYLDTPALKIHAEAANGHFCLLPRHIDFVAALTPGLLIYVDPQSEEHFLAIDEGVLVKCGAEVMVATRRAARGGDLGELKQMVVEQFEVLDQREQLARSAVARLEAGLVRRFLEFEQRGR